MSGNGDRSAGQPMFVPHSHPELKTLGRKPIQYFLREHERYLRLVADAQQQGSTYLPVPVVASVDFDMLTSLIEDDTFEGVNNIADLQDDVLLRWLRRQDEEEMEYGLEELETLVKKSVHIKIGETNPRLRIMALVADYRTFLRQKKLDNLIADNPKVAIAHICAVLRPPTLKRKVENDLALQKSYLKKHWKDFYKYLVQKAVACDEFVSPYEKEEIKDRKENKGTDASRGGGYTRHNRNNVADNKASGTGENKSAAAIKEKADKAPRNDKPFEKIADENKGDKYVPWCLNLNTCKGLRHFMTDCKDTPEPKRQELLDEHKKKIREKKGLKRLITEEDAPRAVNTTHEWEDGLITAKLADTVDVFVSGDYEADHAALSDSHLEQLATANIFVTILPLKDPITMSLAVEGSDEPLHITATRKARISTTLMTLEGPLRLRNVEYLVFKENMRDVLLSRPVLLSLGFDLDAHLASVRTQYHDTDMSHIGFEAELPTAGKLARLMRRGNDGPETDSVYLNDSDDEDSNRLLQSEKTTSTHEVTKGRYEGDIAIGDHCDSDVLPHLNSMIKDAMDNGLPDRLVPRLQTLVEGHADIFRIKLGSDPPVDVPSMRIRLNSDAAPVRVKVRRYAPAQAQFLREKVSDLEKLGLVRRNPSSAWACAPLIVPKDGPEKYRFTTDLRPVNKQTIPHAWPMPDLESVIARLAGKKCFATIDLCQGYWQLPLEDASQECQSFITPEGVYSPTRVMHGQRNAVAFCQSSVQKICEDVLDNLLQWLNDMLLYAHEAEELLDVLQNFFELCRRYNLKLHAKKCKLFRLSIRWCGRIISGDGVRMDPARLQALLDMPEPTMGDQLQQFYCAANWLRSAIPEFTKIVEPLADMLERVYETAGKRTKRAATKIHLSRIDWGTTHSKSFQQLKTALASAVELSHPDPEKLLCLFTDASDRNWSGILSQIPREDKDLPFEDQRHEPLAFLSGSFRGSSIRWSTPEKEAAAIIHSVDRLDYILLRPDGFQMFTDHSNLVFVYNPERCSVQMTKTTLNKVQRWGMILSNFNYTISYISGEDNCWADLLSRWGNKDEDTDHAQQIERKHFRLAALFQAPIAPEQDPDFIWPSSAEIHKSQLSALRGKKGKRTLDQKDGVWRNQKNGAVWSPPPPPLQERTRKHINLNINININININCIHCTLASASQ